MTPAPNSLEYWVLARQGKVRDIYRPAEPGAPDVVLLVASDRVSALDRTLEPEIPGKGRELTTQSRWWSRRLHIATHQDDLPAPKRLPPVPTAFLERATVAWRLDMIPVECIARGYLVGAAWDEYRVSGTVAGDRLPPGLRFGDLLDAPVFTPTTKAAVGNHDLPISAGELANSIGTDLADQLQRLTLAAYRTAAAIGRERGLIVADAKFEFGRAPSTGRILLGDEALTGDSSRIMTLGEWKGPRSEFLGKQMIRQWLAAQPEPPTPDSIRLPDELVAAASTSYQELSRRLHDDGSIAST